MREVWAYTKLQPQRPAGRSRACRSSLRGYFSQRLCLHPLASVLNAWLTLAIPQPCILGQHQA